MDEMGEKVRDELVAAITKALKKSNESISKEIHNLKIAIRQHGINIRQHEKQTTSRLNELKRVIKKAKDHSREQDRIILFLGIAIKLKLIVYIEQLKNNCNNLFLQREAVYFQVVLLLTAICEIKQYRRLYYGKSAKQAG